MLIYPTKKVEINKLNFHGLKNKQETRRLFKIWIYRELSILNKMSKVLIPREKLNELTQYSLMMKNQISKKRRLYRVWLQNIWDKGF